MPNRILKESINESLSLSNVSFFANDLYKRLITYADDYGRFNADYQIMRARLYPRELQIVSNLDIEDALLELSGAGKIKFFTAEPRREIYGCFPNWKEHQRVRESKRKFPDPEDTSVNDWYLRRYIPMNLKIAIIERDNFKCRICGKFVSNCQDSLALAKKGAGLFHIDHIVPVSQGGRSTMENLRLTCPRCNLSRQRNYTAEEIIEMSREEMDEREMAVRGNSPRLAADRRELPLESNPIQYESESESEMDSCSELETSEQAAQPVITLLLNSGAEYGIFQADIDEWQRLYPNVDVLQELRKMKGWCDANPKKRKTKTGIRRFINNWLAKEQDKGPKRTGQTYPQTGKNRFNNFPQREYDYAALERELLGVQRRSEDDR